METGTTTTRARLGDWHTRDAARLQEALELLEQQSPSGAAVMRQAGEGGARITVVPDAQFYERRPYSTGAVYLFQRNEIQIPRSPVHSDPARSAVMLAHEAQHHVDMPLMREAALRFRAGVAGAIEGAAQLRSPIDGYRDAVRRHRDGHEVSAYHLQAAVARELGRPELGSHGSDGNGGTKSEAEVRKGLEESSIYRADKRRAALAERKPGERPPSDPTGAYDGARSVFTIDPSLSPRRHRPSSSHAGWRAGAAGAGLGAALVMATPLRRSLPAPVALASIAAVGVAGAAFERLRQS